MNPKLQNSSYKPIIYHPIYTKITGSVTGGVLLSKLMQYFYIEDKFYKIDIDLQRETGLTFNEFRSAKKRIKKLAFITIGVDGMPAKTYYKIDWEIYKIRFKSLISISGNIKSNLDPSVVPDLDNLPSSGDYISEDW